MKRQSLSRRNFLKGSAAAAAAFYIVPRHVLGGEGQTPPSAKLAIGKIGCGGMGGGDLNSVKGENIVALCDVDKNTLDGAAKGFPQAKLYRDFREMLEKETSLEAVVVSTPDHIHAPATMMALKLGKHVYCQKPLTHTVFEARTVLEYTRQHPKLITQMGNQGHAGEGLRMTKEWIQAGVIGKVKEVHCWTDRPIWRQGTSRPDYTDPVPGSLEWDLWLGPAPERPFVAKYREEPYKGSSVYHPFAWRGWWDFGCGAIGDMAVHNMDPAFYALELGYPASIEADADGATAESGPNSATITFLFPAKGDQPELKMVWYERRMPRPDELEKGLNLPQGNGILFVGDGGKIMCGGWAGTPRLIPDARMKDFKPPAKTIPRVPGSNPYQEWIQGCKGGPRPGSNFEYAAPFTETLLLGNVAIRAGKKILWDGPNMKITNDDAANKFLQYEYRKGWTL